METKLYYRLTDECDGEVNWIEISGKGKSILEDLLNYRGRYLLEEISFEKYSSRGMPEEVKSPLEHLFSETESAEDK